MGVPKVCLRFSRLLLSAGYVEADTQKFVVMLMILILYAAYHYTTIANHNIYKPY